MIDLVDIATKRLKEAGYQGVSLKRFADSKEGIYVRRLPSATRDKYMDGTKTVAYVFQVLVKRKSEQTAIEECCDIADILPGMDLRSANGSYELIKCEVYTGPQELELTEGGYYIWECRFEAEILRKE